MRIAYITSVFDPKGGSEIYCRDLVRELANRGHEVLLVTTSKHEIDGVKTMHLPRIGHHAMHKFFAPLFFGMVLKKVKDFKPDIIQSHSNSFMGLIGERLKKKLGLPHVLLIELISSNNKTIHTKLVFQCEKFLLPKLDYDRLIVWTERIKEKFLLPWGIPESKVEVIPAAVNFDNYSLAGTEGNWIREKYGENLIVSMKTLWETNVIGLEYIIRAMAYVKDRHPEYKYLIFGEGKEKGRLARLISELGLEDYVKLPGHIISKHVKEVWDATQISPHSFVYEFSTSVSLLEFMAVGKPCIVTDIGAVKEFVKDTSLVVEPENPKAMAEAINRLIESPSLRKEFGAKARELVKSNYSIKSTVDRLERIYSGLGVKN